MTIPVLVVGGDPELAALVRRALENEYACQVAVAASSSEALAYARAAEFKLAIIDFDLPDLREADLVRRLRGLQPNILLLAIASDPAARGEGPLRVHATLPKPFYLPDLLEQVQRLLSTLPPMRVEPAGSHVNAIPHRLGNAAEAARLVARGARDSGAYLVLLTRDGRRWVHAGPMPQPHVEQVVAKIQHYAIRSQDPGAVARYLRLPGASDSFLLYCQPLAELYLMAILYPSRVPFGSVRRQAERLADLLLKAPLPAGPQRPPALRESRQMTDEVTRLPRDWMPQQGPRRGLPFLEPSAQPVPAGPAPGRAAPPSTPAATLPAAHRPAEEPMSDRAAGHDGQAAPPARPPEARPAPSREPARLHVSLVYVPRDPALALQGTLADTLVGWTRDICRALDFHPIDIHVRPDALCLTVALPPVVSPPSAAHRMRQELSRRIAETYPSQAAAATSGRFWTSRYLLMSGEPPSSQRITEFVRETRGTSPLRAPG